VREVEGGKGETDGAGADEGYTEVFVRGSVVHGGVCGLSMVGHFGWFVVWYVVVYCVDLRIKTDVDCQAR